MTTVESIASENAPIRPKRSRTLRRDLSDEGPKEFRHIPRLNLEIVNEETSTESANCEDDLNLYFSQLNSPYVASVKPPIIQITRPLTKEDITPPRDFLHVAHISFHELKRSLEQLSEDMAEIDVASEINERLSKEQISEPTNFRHVAHVGIEENQLKMNTEDTTVKFLIQSEKRKKAIAKEDIGSPENFRHLVHIDFNSACNMEDMFEKFPANDDVDKKDKEIESFISEMVHESPKIRKPVPTPRSFAKRDIEKPQDFRHKAHIGYNKEGPKPNEIVLRNFIKKAGLREDHLKDKQTMEFIFDFIRDYSRFKDGKIQKRKAIPAGYSGLAQQIEEGAESTAREEFRELLLAIYQRHNPIFL